MWKAGLTGCFKRLLRLFGGVNCLPPVERSALKVSARLPQIFFAEGENGATKDTPLFIVNGAMSAKPGKGKGTWTLFRPLAQATESEVIRSI